MGILQNTDTHPTASWVYDELKKEFINLSMGTVYRNINILMDQNLVHKIEAGSSFDRFDANTEVHYHFICRECGCIDDLPLAKMTDLHEMVSRETGYEAESHRLDFYGTCPSCSKFRQVN